MNQLPPYIKLGLGRTLRLKPQIFINKKTTDVQAGKFNVVVLLTQSKLFLPRRKRLYLKINNLSANTIYYDFNQNSSVESGIPLIAGDEIEYLNPPYDELHMIATVSDSNVQILEHT